MDSTPRAVRSAAGTAAPALLDRLWRASPPLTAVGALMIVVAGASLVGLLVDPRVITGAPAWLKPFKFAVSTAIYSLTLAWIFGWLSDWPRVRRTVGWVTAIVFVLEVAIIDVQAWRGTTSHFNVSTRLDMALFSVMGTAILLQTVVSVWVAIALWRQHFTDGTLGWALRLGMTLTIAGAFTGALMTRPTAGQLAVARAGGPMPVVGAHTVGGPDGGPGLPVTGLEPRARRCAGAALRRPARGPGAGARRARPAPVAPAGGRARQGTGRGRGQLRDAVSPAAVGSAARTQRRGARCDGSGRDRHLGGGQRARPRRDRLSGRRRRAPEVRSSIRLVLAPTCSRTSRPR